MPCVKQRLDAGCIVLLDGFEEHVGGASSLTVTRADAL
jgi:hypothetical protein